MFKKYVKPILVVMATTLAYIDYSMRLEHNNHAEPFPARFTCLVDTFPVKVAVAQPDVAKLMCGRILSSRNSRLTICNQVRATASSSSMRRTFQNG